MSYNESDKPGGVCHHPASGVWEVEEGCRCVLFRDGRPLAGPPVKKEGVAECLGTETGEIGAGEGGE